MLATRMRMAAAGVTGTPAAGWWVVAGKTCVAAYQPIGAASLAASYTNLANPGTYDAAPGVAPTFDAVNGWAFNTTQYLETGIASDEEPMTVLARVVVPGVALLPAIVSSTATYGATLRLTNGTRYLDFQEDAYSQVAQSSTVISTSESRVLGFSFAANKSWSLWIDGADDKSGTYSRLFSGGGTFRVGRASNSWNSSIQAIAIYSDTLSGAEVAILSAAMAALT